MTQHQIVIVGGGFGGLQVARRLRKAPAEVVLIDRRNFHLFQPLLYQVATGGLSPANIATPLRSIFKRQKNLQVLQANVNGFDTSTREVITDGRRIRYDTLVIATGSTHHYFQHDDWERHAPGLKTVEDALEIRRRVLSAFESAELADDSDRRKALMTFLIVGGGPTGVELAGALGEMAQHTLRGEFRSINTADSRIILCEASAHILSHYPEKLSLRALASLERLGVEVWLNCQVQQIDEDHVNVQRDQQSRRVDCCTVLWGAGVQASVLGKRIADATQAATDKVGRVVVTDRLSIENHDEIFVVGDLAGQQDDEGNQLPGVAQVAIQQGKYVGNLLRDRFRGKSTVDPFRYRDFGNMAVIGRAAAVADMGRLKISGFLAWIAWLFIHLINLVAYQNRILVLIQWGWNYTTRNRSARLITQEEKINE